ncbi:MBL fold metallo-hydrolase [Pontibacter oryzae]|uniref:MBL fold metallo-hydrolase n=1 Tax=Pontibacter oryzae TaxID=2304593 RepID=A0A399SHB8_9BACT|nr:MBL fold metallo-hydrolase [Pontibacter oryzae]RIJ42491.1 MBL fold metallo-hydrolase [Pontibacter oryzae]
MTRIQKGFMRAGIALLSLEILITTTGCIYMQLPQFGKKPTGQRLERIKQSPNYRDGRFQNLSPTTTVSEGYTFTGVMYDYLFRKKQDVKPDHTIPVVETDLQNLPAEDVLVWFGHSSYLLQVDGKKILVDPVLCGYASPVSWTTKAFAGTDVYKLEDLPAVDILLITHDHYDHLDYETMKGLKDKVGMVICGLGVGAHLEHWGFPANRIIEKDWWEKVAISGNMNIHLTPARHFSGRGLKRDQTLWTSFVVETASKKIFLGGDSGYDSHFAAIGKKFGGFDIAILENGQYNVAWQQIHTLPEELVQAAQDLNAKRILPVHSSKFDLGGHPWYEPLEMASKYAAEANLPLATPMIGELVLLNDSSQVFTPWWQGIK